MWTFYSGVTPRRLKFTGDQLDPRPNWKTSSVNQPVSVMPMNLNSTPQAQLFPGVAFMPAVLQAQGVAYQLLGYTLAFWHAFSSTSMLQPTLAGNRSSDQAGSPQKINAKAR